MKRLLIVPGLCLACSTEAPPRVHAPDTALSMRVESLTVAFPDTGCPKVGLWVECAVEDRLERAGMVIEALPEGAAYPFLSVPGKAYKVGAGEDRLEVFLYPSVDARRRDTDALDSASVSPRGQRRSYRVAPRLVTSANLAAIVFTLNDRSRERLELALSAGLPPR
jgi:hypothetical protein